MYLGEFVAIFWIAILVAVTVSSIYGNFSDKKENNKSGNSSVTDHLSEQPRSELHLNQNVVHLSARPETSDNKLSLNHEDIGKLIDLLKRLDTQVQSGDSSDNISPQ